MMQKLSILMLMVFSSFNVNAEMTDEEFEQSEFKQWCYATVNALTVIDSYANTVLRNKEDFEPREYLSILLNTMERKVEFLDDLILSCLSEDSDSYVVVVKEREKLMGILSKSEEFR